MKKVLAIVCTLVLTLSAVGSAMAIQASDINVYWIGKTLNNPWWISVADFAQMEANTLGVNLTIAIPQEEVDLERQITMIEAAVQSGAQALVVSAASSDGIIPAIQAAKEAGAYKAGKYICEQLGGEGDVAVITGLLEQSTGVDRRAGFLRACAEYPNINVVAEQGAEWSSDKAFNVMTNILTANPNLKGVFACNDQMAVGMVNAAEAAGKLPEDLVLVGYDGILDAVNMTLEGRLDAFVSLPNLDEGAMGVKLATALVLNPDYKYTREILYDCTLVTNTFMEGMTDQTIYEFAAERFPLRGLTEKGY